MNTKLKLIQEHPEIKEMLYDYGNLLIEKGKLNCGSTLDEFTKSLKEKPLFITNGDNEEVFEGDIVYFMYPDGKSLDSYKINYERDVQHYHDLNDLGRVWYKNKDKAEQYLIENARVLSIEDVNYWFCPTYNDKAKSHFESIAKQRLNLK